MTNILTQEDVNRLFTLTSPHLDNAPVELGSLPLKPNFNDDKANRAYECLLDKFKKWNKTERFASNPFDHRSQSKLKDVIRCIFQELLLVMRDCSKEKAVHVIRLNELMKEHGGDVKIPVTSKPKRYLKEEVQSNAEQKSPFFIRSKIANLKFHQKKLSYAEIESHTKTHTQLNSKMSRRLRIYGKSRLRSSEIEEEERQMLFRDWLMKERSRQFEIDKIVRSNREKCKEAYTKIAMSDFLDSRPSKHLAKSRQQMLTASQHFERA